MIRVLTIASEEYSALKLGFETMVYANHPVDYYDDDLVIRWGNSSPIRDSKGRTKDFKHVINTQKSIQLNCNKAVSLRFLSKVVSTPKLYKLRVPKENVVVVRPRFHSNGEGFDVVSGPFKLNCWKEYAVQFLQTEIEYRVWFANNHTLCARRVTSQTPISNHPCRSDWGYKFCPTPVILHNKTLAAAAAIGLMTGAADVLRYKNEYYFLELNSAPTIDAKKILQFFQENIGELVKNYL
jgi:hypothetical protein